MDIGTVTIIGAPMSRGQRKHGTSLGPTLLRQRRLRQILNSCGLNVKDSGDINMIMDTAYLTTNKKFVNGEMIGLSCEQLSKVVSKTLEDGDFPLIIGGDHSLSIGSIAGVLKKFPDIGIIWLDAHTDINTPITSPSGNVHGMPLAVLGGIAKQQMGGAQSFFNWLYLNYPNPIDLSKRLVYIGVRDIDPGEKDTIEKYNIPTFTMETIDTIGIEETMRQAFTHLNQNGKHVHVSLDIDVMDPSEAPSTGTLVENGLSKEQMTHIINFIKNTEQIVSLEVVEINPMLGGSEKNVIKTADLANSIIKTLFSPLEST